MYKWSTYVTVCFFTFLATTNASKFTVAIGPLSKEFHVSSTKAGYLTCFNVLLLGVGNIFWVPLMRKVGKRPVFLTALPLLVATNIWGAKATSYNSLLASCILSGFASSAGDATVPAVVADLFFVHQRGTVMMIFHVALSCGFFLGPFINAYIVQYVSWRTEDAWIAVAAGVAWIVAIFGVFETQYPNRDVDKAANEYPARRTYVQMLGLGIGYNKEVSFFKGVWKTLSMFVYPPVTWAGFTVGVFVGWNIVVQLTSSRTFTAAPYHWKTHSLGLLSLGGFLGAILAIFFGGKLIDIIANRMTARNHGRREPEYRLPAILIPAIVGPMGILIFGLTLAHKEPYIAPAVGYTMQGFGLTAVSNVVVTYAVDSYLPLAGEALVFVFVLRGIIGCFLALWAYDWILATGMQNAFGQMVAIQYFVILFGIAFMVWGKKIRAMTRNYGPMTAIVHHEK